MAVALFSSSKFSAQPHYLLVSYHSVCRSEPAEEGPWKRNMAKRGQSVDQDDRIHWAGESHSRATFKKKRDFMMEWCNVLYRS